MLTRRNFIGAGSVAGLLGAQALLPAWARSGHPGASSQSFDLEIGEQTVTIGGRSATATTINGTLPGPLLRMREGDEVTLRVRNRLQEDTSLHWHGLLVPPGMDGVPGISFAGIAPGTSFQYRFTLQQAGTYWYHSHSGLQEQTGVYGPLIIDPAEPESIASDREVVVVLSDWSFEDPERVYAKLKKQADYYNLRKRTLQDLLTDPRGFRAAAAEGAEWARMRMEQSDIADVTGATYSYLLNGHAPMDAWSTLYIPGERLRVRFINASAMTYFNVRIPGLPMTVIQADGQDVQPVETDEFQLAVAETLDVIVTPDGNQAYAIVAESMDRSGMAAGTLSPVAGLQATIPALRSPPMRTMTDMGHGGMDHSGMDHAGMDHAAMGHAAPADTTPTPSISSSGWTPKRSAGVSDVVDNPIDRLAEPGIGLDGLDHRVLTYAELSARTAFYDQRPPSREIVLHLTGNMERYMWSFDGERYSKHTEPLQFAHGERLRLVFINHTMMEHPVHLHGMWMEVENGRLPRPRKHTISVKPAERIAVLVTADAPGEWAFHCHLLLHMKAGMMRTVVVGEPQQEKRHA